jgi:ABC-type dipeptide/oligopeptide/nickel transport system ATPase component
MASRKRVRQLSEEGTAKKKRQQEAKQGASVSNVFDESVTSISPHLRPLEKLEETKKLHHFKLRRRFVSSERQNTREGCLSSVSFSSGCKEPK